MFLSQQCLNVFCFKYELDTRKKSKICIKSLKWNLEIWTKVSELTWKSNLKFVVCSLELNMLWIKQCFSKYNSSIQPFRKFSLISVLSSGTVLSNFKTSLIEAFYCSEVGNWIVFLILRYQLLFYKKKIVGRIKLFTSNESNWVRWDDGLKLYVRIPSKI